MVVYLSLKVEKKMSTDESMPLSQNKYVNNANSEKKKKKLLYDFIFFNSSLLTSFSDVKKDVWPILY